MAENNTPASQGKHFQDPLIRPGIDLQFLGGLTLVVLPLTLLFFVLAKEPGSNTQPAFKPLVQQIAGQQ